MILNVHSNASYLSAPNACSRAGATSSLAVFSMMDLQFKWIGLSTSPAQFSNWWLPLLLRQNLVHSSLMHKKPKSSVLSLKNLVIHNHQLPSTLTTPLLLALLITPPSNNNHALWKGVDYMYIIQNCIKTNWLLCKTCVSRVLSTDLIYSNIR